MAWRKILALGLLAGVAFAGCTVTTDDPDDHNDDHDGGNGGSSSGGKASGGSGTGGKASGGSNSGGSGGEDGGGFTCNPNDPDACAACTQAKCCDEWLECGDDVNCSFKDDDAPGEAFCIATCLQAQWGEAGTFDLAACAGECAEDGSAVSFATSAFIGCLRAESDDGGLQNCSTVCFGGEL